MIAIELLKAYSPVVRSIAGQMNAKTPSKNNMEVFVQVGWVGFLDAMRFFDPGKGEFKNFVGRKIRGQISDFQSGRDLLSLGQRNRHLLLVETKKRCEQMKSRQLSLSEIAKKARVSLNECSFVLSLIELCRREELEKIRLAINCEALDSNEDRSLLIATIEELGDREKIAVGLLYEEQLSFLDAGRVLGISEGRVYQLFNDIIEKLRIVLINAQSAKIPEAKTPKHKKMKRLMRDIKCLNALEKKILILHHSKQMSKKDIAVELDISDVRTRQVYQVAVGKLRRRSSG